MPEIDSNPETPPGPSEHLRPIRGEVRWIRGLIPMGLVLLTVTIVLTVVAPSVWWFLAYPLLVIGALAALTTAAALLLRHL